MKNINYSLALAGGLLFAAFSVLAQTPPDAQCITATATTPYTQPGSTYGNNPNNFDWKAPIWNLWVKQDNGTTIAIAAESPFWAAGNVSYPNTNHLSTNSQGDPRDYEPGDGWELMMDDRGTSTNSVRCPTVILYNRYEAKVRLFEWFSVTDGQYQTGVIDIYRDGILGFTSALFEHANTPMNAIDNFDHSTAARQHNKYVVQGGTWFLTEFAAAYDPCTCVFQSGIEISPRLFNQQTINLNLQGTSISEPIIANSVVQSQSFSKFISVANGLSTALGKGFKNYNSLDEFEKELGEYVGTIIAHPNNVKAPFQLPGFLKSIDKIAAIASVLEFFIGGGKTTSSPKPPSYLNKFKFEAQGTLDQSIPYEIRNSYIPGSVKNVQPPIPGVVPGRIPIYNNPLGLFNILETPKLDITLHPAWFMSFKIKEPIKYAVNPTAGLGGLIQLKGALYYDRCLNGTIAEGLDYNMIAINDTLMRSPFVPLNVLPEYIMHSNWTNGIGCAPSNTLEVIATFKPLNGEEILYAARYKTQLSTPVFNSTVPTNPYAGVPENITVENQNLSSDKTFKAWNTITVNTQSIVFNGHLIYLYTAGTVIFKGPNIPQWIQQRLNADGEFIFDGAGWPPLDPRGDYVPVKWTPGTPNPPQTPGEIAAFCTNPLKYKPQLSVAPPDEEAYAREIGAQMLHNDFKVVPSIAIDYTSIQFDIKQPTEVRMTVLNSLGQIEWEALNEQVEVGTYVRPIDIDQLPKGMYFILIQLDGKRWDTLRFVKQ